MRLGDHAGERVGRGLVDERRQQRGEQVDLDPLALAGAIAMAQRREDADAREQPGEHVDQRDARPSAARRPASPVMLISPPSAWTSRS